MMTLQHLLTWRITVRFASLPRCLHSDCQSPSDTIDVMVERELPLFDVYSSSLTFFPPPSQRLEDFLSPYRRMVHGKQSFEAMYHLSFLLGRLAEQVNLYVLFPASYCSCRLTNHFLF